MPVEFDPRIVRIGIEISGETNYYEGLYITAQGTRYGSDANNECQVRIDNLTREHRDYLLRITSPYFLIGSPVVHISVFAGRKSYGTSLVYYGQVTRSSITQPPDIGVILNCLTCFDQTTNIVSYASGPKISLKSLSQVAASTLGLTLNFQATDKQITNFTLSGSALNYVSQISDAGNVDVSIDNKSLIVKDQGVPITSPIKKISQETGMIGIPEITESGLVVKYLFDNNTVLYQTVNITSLLNPSVNGNYQLYKLGFDISSREVPFYWIASCSQLKDKSLQGAT